MPLAISHAVHSQFDTVPKGGHSPQVIPQALMSLQLPQCPHRGVRTFAMLLPSISGQTDVCPVGHVALAIFVIAGCDDSAVGFQSEGMIVTG